MRGKDECVNSNMKKILVVNFLQGNRWSEK